VRIIEQHLGRQVAAPSYRTEINVRGDQLRLRRDTLLTAKVASRFAYKRRALGRNSSLAD
jgi:hypothetical protein